METINCICCTAKEYIVLLTNKKDEYKRRISGLTDREKLTRFVICKSCGFVYQNPRLELEKLARMYEGTYRIVPPEKHRPPDVDMQAEWIFKMVENKTSGKEILDIGCDTGSLLNVFKKKEWNTFVVEPTVSYAEYGRKEYGHKIETGIYNDKMFEGKKFDLIVASHVIEHVYDPLALLISLRKKIKEGGYMYIGTPNVAKYSVKQKVGFWDMFSCGHLYLFSLTSMAGVLHRAGLEITAFRAAGARDAIDVIVQASRLKKFELLKDNPYHIKKIITLFRIKVPFLKAKRKIRDSYKTFYKAHIRKYFKR